MIDTPRHTVYISILEIRDLSPEIFCRYRPVPRMRRVSRSIPTFATVSATKKRTLSKGSIHVAKNENVSRANNVTSRNSSSSSLSSSLRVITFRRDSWNLLSHSARNGLRRRRCRNRTIDVADVAGFLNHMEFDSVKRSHSPSTIIVIIAYIDVEAWNDAELSV